MAFWDKGNKFPYTNNHDANLDYMMTIFENIKNEWHDLYVDLVEWKGTTTLELNTWKTNALAQIEQYETDFRAEIAVWKANTEQDIGVWEQGVLADLGTWRANFETLFATTFSNLTQIKTDAEAARDAAALSADAALESAEQAESSAESVSSALTQIATNAADISDLKTQLNNTEQEINRNLVVPVDGHNIIQGTYNPNGSVQNSTTRIRTSGFMTLYKGQTLKFIEGTNIKQFFYGFRAAGSTENFTDGGTWNSSGTEIEIPANREYIFVFRKGVSDTITPEDYDANLSIISANFKLIDNLETKFDGYTPIITREPYSMPLEQGKFRTTTIIQYVLNRVKTKSLYYAKNQIVKVNCPNGFEYQFMYWDENKTYRGEDSTISSGNTIKRIDEAYFGINFKKSDDGDIEPADLSGTTICVLDLKEKNITIEQGAFNVDGSLSVHHNNYLQFTRSSFFIKTNGETVFTLNNASIVYYNVLLYDNTYSYLSSVRITGGNKLYTIPTTATYFKLEIYGVGFGDSIKIYYVSDGALEEKKNVQINSPSERLIFDVGGDDCSTAMLILPPNYTPDGKPVPLCYYLDGSGSAGWGETFKDAVLHQVQYCAAEGFAVASIYAWGWEYNDTYSGCRASYPYPVPTHKHIIKKGIEYICSRFNVDINNVHLMSESQGGQLALYFATVPPEYMTIKSIGMFSPVLDYFSMPGESPYAGVRAALVHELSLENDIDQTSPTYDPNGTDYFVSEEFSTLTTRAHNFILYNKDKFIGLNEAWIGLVGGTADERFAESFEDAIKFWGANWQSGMQPDVTREDIYTHGTRPKIGTIPVRIWGAHDDNATPYMKMVETVKQLENGGCEVKLITFPNDTGKHGAPGHGNYVASVQTRYGGTYTNVPGGWYQNVQWAYEKMAIEDR